MPKLFYTGIKAIITNDHKILLLKCEDPVKKNYFWDLPGGRMEENECFSDTLNRELLEELPGIKNIKIEQLIDAYKLPKNLKDGNSLLLLMYKVSAIIPKSLHLSNEHCEYKWINKEELNTIENEAEINSDYKKILNNFFITQL